MTAPTFSEKLREIGKIAFEGRRLSFVEMRAVIHAAAEIERLEGELRAANEAIEEAAKWAAGIAAGLAKPAPTGFLGER